MRRRGSVMFMAAAGLTALLGAGAWVVDLSAGLLAVTRCQAAADAGALAACSQLAPVPKYSNATTTAVDWVARNGATLSAADVSYFIHSSGSQAVTLNVKQPVSTTFARIFGINSYNVGVKASATLGGLTEIPRGFLPFGLPAYQDVNGKWLALASTTPGDYRFLTTSPPTPLILKVTSGTQSDGNFLALAPDGRGGSDYRGLILGGSQKSMAYDTVVDTETGNMNGPTKQGMLDRLALGPSYADIYVPLIKRSEWEANNGRASVTLIGFLLAHVTQVTDRAEILATFSERVVNLPGRIGKTSSPGVTTPLLVMTP